MTPVHWLDRLNKALACGKSRRHAVQALGALAIGLIAGSTTTWVR